MSDVDKLDAFLSQLEFGSDEEPQMTMDEFLAGISSDSDTDTDDEPSPEPVKKPRMKIMTGDQMYKKSLDQQEKKKKPDDYGSIAWQKRTFFSDDEPTKTVDCIVYYFDEDTYILTHPSDLVDVGEWNGEGEDPDWFDEDYHNELKEKYNQNIKNKAGKFSECY